MTAPPWSAVSADTRLAPAALSALWLISPMVAVISCAAAAIWLVLLDWVCALPALSTARALISVVAAERVSAPRATDCSTLRMETTLVLRAAARRPISSVPDSSTQTVRSFSATRSRAAVAACSGGAMSRVSWKPMSAQSRTMKMVTPVLTQVALLLAWVAALDSSVPYFAFRLRSSEIVARAVLKSVITESDASRSRASPVLLAASRTPARLLASRYREKVNENFWKNSRSPG